ncbi:unnamed protein product [Caenorhabditis nigoni]
MAKIGYPIRGCGVEGVMYNEAIVRALMTFRKAERVSMSIEPTTDFKTFDFVTPFTESLENESLQILYPEWVSPWHVNNAFNKCREVRLIDRMFPFAESDVIEILKKWTTESSIRTLTLTFERRRYVRSAWLLVQNNTGVEVLVTVGSYAHYGTHKDFLMRDEFELAPENR